MSDRVVLTWLGATSSIGVGAKEFAAGLRARRSGAKPITSFDTTGFAHANGCEITDFEPRDWIRRLDLDGLGRASQFSVAATRMAVADAAFAEQGLATRRGLTVGTTDSESSSWRETGRRGHGHCRQHAAGIDGRGADEPDEPLVHVELDRGRTADEGAGKPVAPLLRPSDGRTELVVQPAGPSSSSSYAIVRTPDPRLDGTSELAGPVEEMAADYATALVIIDAYPTEPAKGGPVGARWRPYITGKITEVDLACRHSEMPMPEMLGMAGSAKAK